MFIYFSILGAFDHDLDGISGSGSSSFESLQSLLELEAMRYERLDIDFSRGNHVDCSRIAVGISKIMT